MLGTPAPDRDDGEGEQPDEQECQQGVSDKQSTRHACEVPNQTAPAKCGLGSPAALTFYSINPA
jgi:hypothetical protein